MKVTGPGTETEGKLDFSTEGWEWGEILDQSLKQMICDQVATVIWDEIVKGVGEGAPSVEIDDENGEPCLSLPLLGLDYYLSIPLREIIVDQEIDLMVRSSFVEGVYSVDWVKTKAVKEEVLRELERLAAEVRQTMVNDAEEEAREKEGKK